MLEVIVFLSGAILMALEILGSRVLAPEFGNSIFVWGSLIGVFLGALAVGYSAGGHMADARPVPANLGALLMGAGGLVLAVPALAGRVAGLAALGPRLGPLLAALALFFAPTVLMGAVSPYAVRLTGADRERLGRVAGRLYALSTAGSIAGTLVTAFWLVPLAGVMDLVRWLGAGLLALSLAIFLREARWAGLTLAGAGLLAALFLLRPGAPAAAPTTEVGRDGQVYTVLHREDSQYHHIRVTEREGVRHLRFDNSWQSAMDLADPYRTVFPYLDYLHLAPALRPGSRDVLFVGLGGGSAPTRFLRDYQDVQVDVAEIDPAVVRVARKYFGLPDDPRLQVYVQDGRRYLEETRKRYDVIIMDAYYADAIPFHLLTREFMQLARSRLKEGGVVGFNIIGSLEGPRSALFRSFYRTLAQVFPDPLVFPVEWAGDPGAYRNIIVVAPAGPGLRPEQVMAAARAAVQGAGGRPDLPALAAHLWPRRPDPAGVPVLTDDYAPVDSLLHLEP